MIVLDLETTGLDATKHGVIDFAAMDFENTDNFFHHECRLQDGKEVDLEALKINGFTEEYIKGSELLEIDAVFDLFLEWSEPIRDKTVAGQNVDFDLSCLKQLYLRNEVRWNLGHRKVDLHSLAYAKSYQLLRKLPVGEDELSSMNSDAIMKFVGIPTEPKPHKAPNGVLWEVEAFSRIIQGTSKLEQFADFPVPEYLDL